MARRTVMPACRSRQAARIRWPGIPARDAGRGDVAACAAKCCGRAHIRRWGVYANVFMGQADTRVEYRVDDRRMETDEAVSASPTRACWRRTPQDDRAERLRGYDRSPEAEPSPHLWRGALPTELAVGEHRVEVRAFDHWHGEQAASTTIGWKRPRPDPAVRGEPSVMADRRPLPVKHFKEPTRGKNGCRPMRRGGRVVEDREKGFRHRDSELCRGAGGRAMPWLDRRAEKGHDERFFLQRFTPRRRVACGRRSISLTSNA